VRESGKGGGGDGVGTNGILTFFFPGEKEEGRGRKGRK